MQLSLDGKPLDTIAIELIQAYSNKDDPYYLGFSGGKDSVVIYDLALRSGVAFDAHYCVSPIDPPQIHQFIKENYPAVAWDYYAKGFWATVVRKGLPLRQSRWCCALIKEAGGIGRSKILGMRAAESNKRRGYKCFSEHEEGTTWLLPILQWSESDVWQYIAERNLKTCSLYREGFTRIGCILCPFTRNIKLEENCFPKTVANWKRACDRIVAKRKANGYLTTKGKPFKYKFETGEELYKWWVQRG